MQKRHVIVIGAGYTGCATAHDLAPHGLQRSGRGDIHRHRLDDHGVPDGGKS